MRLEKSNYDSYGFTDYHSKFQGYINDFLGKRYSIDNKRKGFFNRNYTDDKIFFI